MLTAQVPIESVRSGIPAHALSLASLNASLLRERKYSQKNYHNTHSVTHSAADRRRTDGIQPVRTGTDDNAPEATTLTADRHGAGAGDDESAERQVRGEHGQLAGTQRQTGEHASAAAAHSVSLSGTLNTGWETERASHTTRQTNGNDGMNVPARGALAHSRASERVRVKVAQIVQNCVSKSLLARTYGCHFSIC